MDDLKLVVRKDEEPDFYHAGRLTHKYSPQLTTFKPQYAGLKRPYFCVDVSS